MSLEAVRCSRWNSKALRLNFGRPEDGWGKLWLWVDGQIVGNPEEIEMIIIGLGPLRGVANEDRAESSSLIAHLGPEQALEVAMWASYEDDDSPAFLEFAGKRDILKRLEVLPGGTGPFFDNWEAVLFERGTQEQFVYRGPSAEVHPAVWPTGTFRGAINQAPTEFSATCLSEPAAIARILAEIPVTGDNGLCDLPKEESSRRESIGRLTRWQPTGPASLLA